MAALAANGDAAKKRPFSAVSSAWTLKDLSAYFSPPKKIARGAKTCENEVLQMSDFLEKPY